MPRRPCVEMTARAVEITADEARQTLGRGGEECEAASHGVAQRVIRQVGNVRRRARRSNPRPLATSNRSELRQVIRARHPGCRQPPLARRRWRARKGSWRGVSCRSRARERTYRQPPVVATRDDWRAISFRTPVPHARVWRASRFRARIDLVLMSRTSLFAITRVLAPVLLVANACGESVSKGAPPVSTASTPQSSAGAHDTIRVRTATDTVIPDTSKRAPVAAAVTATIPAPAPAAVTAPAHDVVVPRLSVHRSPQDSVSYVAAIRAGMRRTERGEWPVKSPAPLPGALSARASHRRVLRQSTRRSGWVCSANIRSTICWRGSIRRSGDGKTRIRRLQCCQRCISSPSSRRAPRDATECIELRMPDTLIERVYQWAQRKHALLFLDIQVGHSTVQQELPRLLKFLERPDVHLGLDPEFSMHYDKEGLKPSTKIGTMMAADVNYAVRTLVGSRRRQAPSAEGARRSPLHEAHGAEPARRSRSIHACRS